ncbi:MAG: TetR/AcrR family transcriptional regulator [Acidaminobacteraceae bacterium]
MKEMSFKKDIQRCRKMSYFIDAADQIISEKGIESLNIREVSDIAGFNSATLYGYFSNLDHLVYYSYVKHISEFVKLLKPSFEIDINPSDSLEITLREYCKFTYENPNVIYTFMFSPYSDDFKGILDDYAKIYGKKFKVPTDENGMTLFKNSIFDIILVKLKAFERELNLDEKEIDEINSFIKTYFQGQLIRLMTYEADITLEEYVNRMITFINQIIWSYTVEGKMKDSIKA